MFRHRPVASLVVTIAACSQGCAALPMCDAEAKRDAIGTISVSAPHFVPVVAAAQGDKALAFGQLRDEQQLAERIEQPSIGITSLVYEGWRAALQAKYSGPQLNVTETRASKGSGSSSSALDDAGVLKQTQEREVSDSYDKEAKRTFSSPEAPPRKGSDTFLDAPPDVERRMFAMLDRTSRTFVLSPAERASLIASYKMLMVNMEEYYNFSGFKFDDVRETDYLPYRVHFTVTAEPGWYTRFNPYDAVTEVVLGDAGVVKVLAVTPAETAQAIDQFQASLQKLQLALELEGTAQQAAARLQLDYIRETVERLEGIRNNNTLVVGFRDGNTVRVRFRPLTVPTDERRDMQPTSRVLTAWVLVRKTPSVIAAGKQAATLVATEASIAGVRSAESSEALEVLPGLAVGEVEASERVAETRKIQLSGIRLPAGARLPFDLQTTARVPDSLKTALAADLDTEGSRVALERELDAALNESLPRQRALREVQERLRRPAPDWSHTVEGKRVWEQALEAAMDFVQAQESANRFLVAVRNALRRGALSREDEQIVPTPGACSVVVSAWYAAALEDDGKEWTPPRWPFRAFGWSNPVERHDVEWPCAASSTTSTISSFAVPIPLWPGPDAKPFEITNAFGYYWGDFALAAGLFRSLEAEAVPLNQHRTEHAKAVTEQAATKAAAEVAAKDVLTARANVRVLEQASASTEALRAARIELGQAEIRESEAVKAADRAKVKVSELAERIKLLEKESDARRRPVQEELAKVLAKGRGAVGYTIRSSSQVVERTPKGRLARDTAVWVRVTGYDEAQDRPFIRVGSGDVGGTLKLEHLDLSMSVPVLDPKEYPAGVAKELRVFVEAALVDARAEMVDVDPVFGLRALSMSGAEVPVYGRIVKEVPLEPRARTSPVARLASEASKQN